MSILTKYSCDKLCRLAILMLICIAISIVSSCNSDGDSGRLEKRIDSLYKAEASRDWKHWYQMMWSELQCKLSFEEFVKECEREKRKFSIISWKVKSVSPTALPSSKSVNVDEAVAVAMDVVVEYSDGRRETSPYQTDYWVKDKGKWCWFWRGWPSD